MHTLSRLSALALLGSVMVLPGCELFVSGKGTPERTAKGPVEQVTEVQAKEEEAEEDEFVYNPIGKRDPFKSFLGGGDVIDRDGPPRTATQKYELDQYQLVGIIWGVERPRALLQDPDAVGHVAEIGTYVGRNWGKITMITSGEVVVTEEYQTIDGELVVNNISMRLPGRDQEGTQ